METQEISGEFLFKAWPWIEAHRRQLIGGVIGVAVLVGIISVVSAARGQKEISAGIALSKLLTTPPVDPEALLQLASAQSGTQAALRAQLQAATAYFENGKYTDAQAQYQGFADAHPTGPLAGEAFLGAGASLEAEGKADQAVSWYNKAAAGSMEAPATLMAKFALGRISELQGKLTEAQGYFQDVTRLGTQISIGSEAYQHLAIIKQKLAVKPAAAK